MAVLLLRLSGPLQSWGVQSHFTNRDTEREPSKSGVIGLLCAALGRTRTAPIDDLVRLRMGVRVDQPGERLKDFHTAQNVRLASAKAVGIAGGKEVRDSISDRYYLMDARFLVGLEGDDLALLTTLYHALQNPHWPLYLGRKACVPGQPVWLEQNGLQADKSLEQALAGYPWLGPARVNEEDRPTRLRLAIEDPNGPIVRPDQPISFDERTFGPRRLSIAYCDCPAVCLEEEVARCSSRV
ncbi:MAG: type I-E CRISPR-associated protein Cas5/CasD [Anaerolineales bacterium]